MSRADCHAVKGRMSVSLRSQISLDPYKVCSFTSVTRDSDAAYPSGA